MIKWNSEKILSLAAISMSFVTMLIFIYQTNLMRRQNYITILPYLATATTENIAENQFQLNLKNMGVGPAIIETATITYQGKTYDLTEFDDEIFNILLKLDPALDSIKHFSTGTLNKGLAIPANTSYSLLLVQGTAEEYELITRRLGQLLANGLGYQIVYKSIQEEKWLIHNNSDGPIRLR